MCETEGSALISIRKHNSFISRIMQLALVLAVSTFGMTNVQAQDHSDEKHDEVAHAADHAEDAHDHATDESHSHGDDAEHHADESAGHGDHADGHGDGHETPPIWEDLSFWSIIAFAGFCFAIVKLGLWDSLITNMTAREDNENAVISTAESHLASAQASLNQYRGQLEAMDETVAETLAEAKRDAAHTETEIIEHANREAAQMLERAKHEIERTKDQSLNNLFDHLSKQVTAAAEAKIKSDLQSADQDKLIDDTLNQFAAS